MRGPGHLAGMTLRGRCFLACGGVCALFGVLFGERDLVRLGVFLLALPVLALVALHRTRYRLSCTRWIDPARVPVGQPTTVTLRLENLARLPTGVLLGEDTLPAALGGRPRFVLDRIEQLGVREVRYDLRSGLRGRFDVGPLAIRLTDPFGLAELSRAFPARDSLIVSPEVVPLPRVALGGEWSGGGDSRARSVASAGEQDVAPREYREGDDLRRVHWRSTARYGELMVRREEQPWQARACVLLDTRRSAHRGTGRESSFEWSVSAAASVAAHLTRAGYVLRFLDDGGDELAGDGEADPESRLLDALAVVTASPATSLLGGVEALRRGGGEGLLVAVLGLLSTAEVQDVARLRTGGATAVALLLDADAWDGDASVSGRTAFEGNVALLRTAGWRVIPVGRGAELPQIWPFAGTRLASPWSGGPQAPVSGAAAGPAGAGAAAGAAGSAGPQAPVSGAAAGAAGSGGPQAPVSGAAAGAAAGAR